jgi:hypothetical protein
MLRRVCVLVLALGLGSPAAASATTRTQARHAVERKLAAVYGDAWRHHTPSWSRPECRQPVGKGRYGCLTEFKHAGLWYLVDAGVRHGKVKLSHVPRSPWVRRWSDEQPNCQDGGPNVVGRLWGNRPGCDALTLWQNFGTPKGNPNRVRYTGFKKGVFVYGTGTALWPDFYLYRCSYRGQTFECRNRFGDGFRWMPHEDSGRSTFYAEFATGSVGCVLGSAGQLICEGFPVSDDVGTLMQFATLLPDGTFTTCISDMDDPECFEGGLQAGTPTFKPGEQLTVGPYGCAVADAAVQCTATANAKGFAISPLQILPVGG